MFCIYAKAAAPVCHTVRARMLCLLSFTLLVPLITSAAPDVDRSGCDSASLSLLQDSPSRDGKKDFGRLGPGEIVKQKIGRGEVHTFRIALMAGQYARVVVEQQSVDLTLRVSGSDGVGIIEIDSPNGLLGPESASVMAQMTGDYTLEIKADKTSPDGSYELKIETLREPTQTDIKRMAAERLFAEGQKQRYLGTKQSRELAIEKYKEAQAIWETLGDVQAEAYALCNIGRAFRALGSFPDSIDYLNRVLLLLQGTPDVAERAFILNEIGTTHRDLGDPLQALEPYSQALELRRSIGDPWGQAQMLNNIGLVYWNTGYYRKAIENYEEAIRYWREAHDHYNEANTRNNLGEAYAELSELPYAMENFQQVLKFTQEVGDKRLEAYVRNNLGKLFEAGADPQEALHYYEDALKLFQDLKISSGEALVLDNIGMAHADAGDTELGLEYLKKSLEIRQQLNEPRGLSLTLTNIGYIYALQKDQPEALNYFNRALPFSIKSHNKLFIAYALLSAGMAYASSNEPKKAIEYYQQALNTQKEMDDRRGQAIALDGMGQAYASLGELSEAFASYDQALQAWRALNYKQGEAQTLYGIAKAELERANLSEALRKIEQAIEIVESLRTKMTSQRLQITYFATKQDYYALNIEVRMRLYDATLSAEDKIAGLYVSEQARARNLLDLLSEAHANTRRGVPSELTEKNNRLERNIDAQAEALMRLRNLNWTEKAVIAERQLNELITQYDSLQAEIRAASKSAADLKRPQPLRLNELQQLLDDDTLLLEYALGEKRSYLWVVTTTTIDSYALPGRAEIEQAATSVRELLTAYEPPKKGESREQYGDRLTEANAHYWQRATELSRKVLSPIYSYPRAKRLVVIADGVLQYIPFEALPVLATSRQSNETSISDKTTQRDVHIPLITQYEILYEPSASTLAELRAAPKKNAAKSVAVLADPVFDNKDERVAKDKKNLALDAANSNRPRSLSRALRDAGDIGSQAKLERLDYTENEANEIIAVASPNSWLKAVGFKANRDLVMSPEMKQYAIIHFATHGIFDDKHPELSGLVLTLVNEQGMPVDGFLRLHDIYNLDLSANLIVLSSCRTGIGKQVKGEGLIGLTRGFMYVGARRVVASLWRVDDEATAELMKRFYWHLLKERKPASTSLRLAQLEIMGKRDQWRAPYYWAGFVLQGDWK